MASEMPLTVGLALLAVPAVWFLSGIYGKEERTEDKTAGLLAGMLSLLSIWMATCLFPYTWIAERVPLFQMPIVSIQYLWRFFSVAALLLSWLFCLFLKKEKISPDMRRAVAGVLAGLALWQGIFYMGQCLQDARPYRVYQAGNMSTMKAQSASSEEQESVMGGEYLPVNRGEAFSLSDYVAAYVEQPTYDETNISLEAWGREAGAVAVRLENRTDQTQQVEVPVLYYKGYRAVTDSGEPMQMIPGTSYRVSLSVPSGFAGGIRVEFQEPLYWRVAEFLSLAVFIGFFVCRAGFLKKKHKIE